MTALICLPVPEGNRYKLYSKLAPIYADIGKRRGGPVLGEYQGHRHDSLGSFRADMTARYYYVSSLDLIACMSS